jgi:hypothetical protein
MYYFLYIALPLVLGFLGGFVFQTVAKKMRSSKPQTGVPQKRKNIGVYDRVLRALTGVALVVYAFVMGGQHVVAFFVAGFCFFEAISKAKIQVNLLTHSMLLNTIVQKK